VCPNCGAESLDDVDYCGSCGKSIRGLDGPTNASETEASAAPEASILVQESPARDEASRLPTSKLTIAVFAAAVAVALIAIGFVLNAYYYERILNPGRDFEEYRELFEIAKYATYARLLGEVSALIGAVLVIQALMTVGFVSASAAMKRMRLKTLLWLGIVMAVLIGITTAAIVYVSETEADLSDTAMDVYARMTFYSMGISLVLGAAALFIVTFALRSASIDGGTNSFAAPPKMQ